MNSCKEKEDAFVHELFLKLSRIKEKNSVGMRIIGKYLIFEDINKDKRRRLTLEQDIKYVTSKI